MSTVNDIVREQISAEGPNAWDEALEFNPTNYVNEQLRCMKAHELLERISDAIEQRIVQDQRVVQRILG